MCTRYCGPAKKCSRCQVSFYCDSNCQRRHWSIHKLSCTPTAKKKKAPPAETAAATVPGTGAHFTGWKNQAVRALEADARPTVLFLGLARDAAEHLDACLTTLGRMAEKIFGGARDAGFLFFENDSRDATPGILADFASRRPTHRGVLTAEALDERYPDRTVRLAHCRNALLKEAERRGWLENAEYVVVADLDDVNVKVDLSGAAAAKWHLECGGAHVCCASQPQHYYDLWALRTEAFDVNSWALDHRRRAVDEGLAAWFPKPPAGPLLAAGGKGTAAPDPPPRAFSVGYDVPRKDVIRDEVRFSRHAPPVPVLSAFGGLAIYNAEVLRGAAGKLAPGIAYDGSDAAMVPPVCHPLWTGQDCEHVSFHASLRKATPDLRVCVHPRLLNALHQKPPLRLPALRDG